MKCVYIATFINIPQAGEKQYINIKTSPILDKTKVNIVYNLVILYRRFVWHIY